MSLITEALKKLKNRQNEESTAIPPQIESSLKEGKKARKRFYVILASFILSGVSLAGAYYIYELYYKNPYESIIYPKHKERRVVSIQKEQVPTTHSQKQELKNTVAKKTEEQKNKESKTSSSTNKSGKKENTNTQKGFTNNAMKAPPKIPISKKDTLTPKAPQRFSASNSQSFLSFIALAEYYVEQGNFDEAIKNYEYAVKLRKDPEVIKNLLVLYIQTGNLDKLKRFYPYIQRYRKISNAVVFTLAKEGYIDEIKKIAALVKRKDLQNFYYGIYYEKLSDLNTALQLYKLAHTLNPSDLYIGYAYGRILEAKLKYKKALEIYLSLPKVESSPIYPIIKNRVNVLKEVLGE